MLDLSFLGVGIGIAIGIDTAKLDILEKTFDPDSDTDPDLSLFRLS